MVMLLYLIDSYSVSLLASLLAILLLGGWVVTYKVSKWRFELYYINFILGFVLVSLLAFATIGSLGPGITSMDNIAIARQRLIFMGFAAGALAALGVALQLALASLSGIGLSFLITGSIALGIHYLQFVFLLGRGNALIGCASAALAFAAAALSIAAYRVFAAERNAAAAASPSTAKKPNPAQLPYSPVIGIVLGVGGGLILGFLFYAIRLAHVGDIELQPYPIALFGALGALLSAPIYQLVFLNLPLGPHGTARVSRYLKGTRQQHLLSLAGGLLFGLGYLLLLLALYGANPASSLRTVQGVAIGYSSALVAALYGIIGAGELRVSRGLILSYLSILFFLAALGLSLFAE